MFKKTSDFIRSLFEHVFAGLPVVSEQIRQERLYICSGCEWFQDGICGRCSCHVEVKAGWAEQECPLKKWKRATPTETAKAADQSEPGYRQEEIPSGDK